MAFRPSTTRAWSLRAAKSEAKKAALEMAQSSLAGVENGGIAISIRDNYGKDLGVVTITIAMTNS